MTHLLTAVSLRDVLSHAFAGALVDVQDDSRSHAGHFQHPAAPDGVSGTHFQVRLVSADFEGKSFVERHRMIYRVLRAAFEGGLHALQIHAVAPSEAGLAHLN